MRIDAHQHFWKTARGDYGWLTPALETLWRDFLPQDLAPLLKQHQIDKTILVQAAPTEAETHFLLDLAERTPFVAGVVGWTDLAAEDAPRRIAALAQSPLLVGLRPMVQDIDDDNWLLRQDLGPALKAMVHHDLVFDALVLPRHLARLRLVLHRHPELRVVVDHAAKPEIRQRHFTDWRDDMAAIAEQPQTCCKLSGLVTEATADWTIADLEPVAACLFATFGPQRLLFGSDWPVVTLAADYGRWVDTAEALCAPLTATQRAAIFGANAAAVYLRHRGRR